MKLSLYSDNLSTYYKIITLIEGKNSCTSLIMNGLSRSVNLESKLWCPGFFQKLNKTHYSEHLQNELRSFFGRIKETIFFSEIC